MKKFFKEYHSYFVYCIAFLYVLSKAYYNEIQGNFWDVYIKEVIAFTIFIILIITNFFVKKSEVHIRDNEFLDTLQNDLTSDRNPFFIQIRKDEVPIVTSIILRSISEAVLSKEWWDFSYFSKTDQLISEIENSFNGSNKTANLTVLKKFPFKENYIFIGTIQRNPNIGFPSTITFLPSSNSAYNIEFNRLYVYKKNKGIFSKKNNSFKLIKDNLLIEKRYKKVINELNKNIEENSYHINWDSAGKVTYQKHIKQFSDFILELKK